LPPMKDGFESKLKKRTGHGQRQAHWEFGFFLISFRFVSPAHKCQVVDDRIVGRVPPTKSKCRCKDQK